MSTIARLRHNTLPVAPRFIQIKGTNLEAEPMRFTLYTTNTDAPAYVDPLGQKLGDLGINIATFALGREQSATMRSPSSASTLLRDQRRPR